MDMLKIIGKAYGNILNPHDGFSIYVFQSSILYVSYEERDSMTLYRIKCDNDLYSTPQS